MIEDSLGKVLLSAESIRRKVREIGAEISRDYAGKQPVLVGVLNGALVFMADLMREIEFPLETYMMAASSYDGYESTGTVDIIKPPDVSITSRNVILVEDIVDTGITLDCLLESLQAEKPASLEVCALLDKKSRRQVEVPIKYVGFEIPDEFVVGYGLDYNQQYRNLPYVASMNAAAVNGTR